MKRLTGESMNITEENMKAMQQLFPEAFEEGKIDFDVLRQLLGDFVDDEQERYSFKWNGKGKALRLSQTPSLGTLRPCKEESKDWDTTENLYIEGDNLEVLKLLQKSYYGKVKMIYIDPPYNTGTDFIYKDDTRDNIKNYHQYTKQIDSNGHKIDTNTEANGRFHTKWLNMMYPRLRLARNLLSDDGVIFISIDDNEQENLKKICNEVFGESNYVGQWNWYKSATPPNLSKKIKKNIEYILCYEKLCNSTRYKGIKKTSPSSNGLLNQSNKFAILTFPKSIVQTGLKDGTYHAGKYGTTNYEINLLDDAIVKDGIFVNQFRLQAKFKWSQTNLEKEISNGTTIAIQTKTFSPSYEKIDYAPEVPPNFINKDVYVDTTEQAGKILTALMGIKPFDYPKPIDLICYLSNFICDDNSLILDFFSGSATTAHAVMQLNAEDGGTRKFIMVQLPEPTNEKSEAYKAGYKNICEIGKERIRRAGEKIKNEATDKEKVRDLDIGFKVFKLDSSNLKKWNPQPENIQLALQESTDNFLPGRSQLDVVYEVLLKMGLDLSLPIEEREADGETVYIIGDGALMICLSEHITLPIAEEIAKLHMEYDSELWQVVFRDTGFASDMDKTNIKETLKAAGLDEDSFVCV